jgi:hypothetical protein
MQLEPLPRLDRPGLRLLLTWNPLAGRGAGARGYTPALNYGVMDRGLLERNHAHGGPGRSGHGLEFDPRGESEREDCAEVCI